MDRVREADATYIVERGGVPVARISPVVHRRATIRNFRALLGERGRASEAYPEAVEAAVTRHNKPRVRRNPWGR